MKRIYMSILAATVLFAACKSAPEGEVAEVAEEQTVGTEAPKGDAYAISAGSKVSFYGATPTHGQNGDFPVSSGTIYVDGSSITGGSVSVKLADIVVTSEGLPDKKKEDLKGHLLSADFFNAEANPEVSFEITQVEVVNENTDGMQTITGNLAMNGKTNSISFPAKIEMNDEGISANAEFVINRKDWAMSYKNDESLGDDWIYDKVKMTLAITAAK